MFPTPEYIKSCIENADRLEWEPKFGDWAIEKHSKDIVLIVKHWADFVNFVPLSWEGWEEGYIQTGHRNSFVPLFTLRQIIEMLAERGYGSQLVVQPDISLVNIWGERKAGRFTDGPDPETALLRAWLEVVKEK